MGTGSLELESIVERSVDFLRRRLTLGRGKGKHFTVKNATKRKMLLSLKLYI
jgi:hypothetical protein